MNICCGSLLEKKGFSLSGVIFNLFFLCVQMPSLCYFSNPVRPQTVSTPWVKSYKPVPIVNSYWPTVHLSFLITNKTLVRRVRMMHLYFKLQEKNLHQKVSMGHVQYLNCRNFMVFPLTVLHNCTWLYYQHLMLRG